MTQYEYDDVASAELRMDVVHEIPGSASPTASTWVEAMRRLNTIDDRLARDLVELHRACGTGEGECDQGDEDPDNRPGAWGCETTAVIARHFKIEFPKT